MSLPLVVGFVAWLIMPIDGGAPQQAGAVSDAATVDTILRLEREWERAVKSGNQIILDRIVAPESVFISTTGKLMTRGEADLENRERLSKTSASTIVEIQVRVFGETSVVVGLTRDVDKARINNVQYRWSHVFVRRQGGWQVVSSHWTRVN